MHCSSTCLSLPPSDQHWARESKGGLELFQKDTNKRQRSPGLFGSASARRHDWDVVLTTAARQAFVTNQYDSTLMVPELHHPPIWISSTTFETLHKVPHHHHESLSIGICVQRCAGMLCFIAPILTRTAHFDQEQTAAWPRFG